MAKATNGKSESVNARDRILDSALEMMGEVGARSLTLDAVATRAGISKGGLLYHFRFKDQLLRAANERLVHRRLEARRIEASRLPDTPSRALKAYVLASINNRSGNDVISTRVLSASALADDTAEPIRQYFKDRVPPFVQDVGFERAVIAHLATEGLWFMERLRLSPFTEKERKRIVKAILAVSDGTDLLAEAPGKPASKQPVKSTPRPSVGRKPAKATK